MLVITRKVGETLRIGEATVHVLRRKSGAMRLGIEAPSHVRIVRGEIIDTEEPAPQTERGTAEDAEPARA